jgi:hypothetical protein
MLVSLLNNSFNQPNKKLTMSIELNPIETTLDAIPDYLHELYTQEGEVFKLTAVKGLKTSEDIAKISEALRKERSDLAAAKAELSAYKEINLEPAAIMEQLSLVEELKAAKEAKLDDGKFDQAVASVADAKVKSVTRPLEAKLQLLEAEYSTATTKLQQFEQERRARIITDNVQSAITKHKIPVEFHEHIHLVAEREFEVDDNQNPVTKDGLRGVPGYLNPDLWISECQARYPHWFGTHQGGGATGSGFVAGGTNPFKAGASFNVTAQARMIKENPALAERMQQAAGK